MELLYDKTDAESIEDYATGLIGKSFRKVCKMNGTDIEEDNISNKGGLGTLLEKEYFHYEPNSDSDPDFAEAGVELKTTGYLIKSKDNKISYSAKERLVLNMIDYMAVVREDDFESSHFWYKNRRILLVFYLYQKYRSRLDFVISYVSLFTPNGQDLIQIREDYKSIIKKIQDGLAHELSEADTMYLSAATKSSSAAKRRQQPCCDIPAKPRAFSYKPSYMTYVLNTYILGRKSGQERIAQTLIEDNLENYIVNQINKYKGMWVEDLLNEFDIKFEGKIPKNYAATIAFRALNIKNNSAEEFVKANIQVKSIRLEPNGKIEQHMSFPAFKFEDILHQDWTESDLYETLSTTKFLFVVFQRTEDGRMYLKGAQFWNMPTSVLDKEVRLVWRKTQIRLAHIDEVKELHNGRNYIGIFPRVVESNVAHVRPHGNDTIKDITYLPDGRPYPKQCFWLRNTYVLSVLNDELKRV